MEDEQIVEKKTEVLETATDDISSILQRAAFDDEHVVEIETKVEEAVGDVKKTADSIEVEIQEPKEWLKKEFGIEDAKILKLEREELKAAKEKLKKFELDDNGLKILDYLKQENEDKLFDFLSNKKLVERLSKSDLSKDKNAVVELVKFGIKNKNKEANLSDDEVDFLFNEKYGIPEKPEQDLSELDSEFEQKMKVWEKQKESLEKRLIIEAKINQPQISELNRKLILPDIQREIQPHQRSQEDLEAAKKTVETFYQLAEQAANSFNGFSVQVKDKDVDYLVGYSASKEEKAFIAKELKNFAESNFDGNAILADRWVESDGKTIKVEQMVKDLSRIYYGEKVEQKIAVEAANKRMEEYLKNKKQIDIKETNEEGKLQLENKNETIEDRLRERMFQLS